jgi:conserved domain protein
VIDSKIDKALSGHVSINESAHNNNGFFTEGEEQEERETDIKMLPTLTSKIENTNK